MSQKMDEPIPLKDIDVEWPDTFPSYENVTDEPVNSIPTTTAGNKPKKSLLGPANNIARNGPLFDSMVRKQLQMINDPNSYKAPPSINTDYGPYGDYPVYQSYQPQIYPNDNIPDYSSSTSYGRPSSSSSFKRGFGKRRRGDNCPYSRNNNYSSSDYRGSGGARNPSKQRGFSQSYRGGNDKRQRGFCKNYRGGNDKRPYANFQRRRGRAGYSQSEYFPERDY